MPRRKVNIITGGYYHVYNRGVNKNTVFHSDLDYIRGLNAINYYRYSKTPLRLSSFLKLNSEIMSTYTKVLETSPKLVDILCYCLMPNHYHLLLKQNQENGIVNFMGNFQNSLVKYVNKRTDRIGPMFQNRYKAVNIETETQLLHLSRYIHLNPCVSKIISISDLNKYKWSSYHEYTTTPDNSKICETNLILSCFKDVNSYKKFINSQIDHSILLKRLKLE